MIHTSTYDHRKTAKWSWMESRTVSNRGKMVWSDLLMLYSPALKWTGILRSWLPILVEEPLLRLCSATRIVSTLRLSTYTSWIQVCKRLQQSSDISRTWSATFWVFTELHHAWMKLNRTKALQNLCDSIMESFPSRYDETHKLPQSQALPAIHFPATFPKSGVKQASPESGVKRNSVSHRRSKIIPNFTQRPFPSSKHQSHATHPRLSLQHLKLIALDAHVSQKLHHFESDSVV